MFVAAPLFRRHAGGLSRVGSWAGLVLPGGLNSCRLLPCSGLAPRTAGFYPSCAYHLTTPYTYMHNTSTFMP
jgi:hypothetical protein